MLLGAGLLSISLSTAQMGKQFSIENDSTVRRVHFDFNIDNGDCFIKALESDEILSVYGNKDHDGYSHSFNKLINGDLCTIRLQLDDNRSAGLSRSISHRMFGNDSRSESNLWKLYLSEDKTFDLNLRYGIGNADIDLTGLSLKKVKINTGSADVYITSKEYNKVAMDTFYVQVDMGSIEVNRISLTRSQTVMAEVGFGDLVLDFGEPVSTKTSVNGIVGAGNLMIVLPDNEMPTIVKINESWLCRVELLKSFKGIGNNTFVNHAYRENAPDLLSFNLEVSMGKITFRTE